MLAPTPLAEGESYGTVADIRDCADLPSMPFTPGFVRKDGGFEPFWTRPDGSPIRILVRAPNHTERRLINEAAGESDDAFVLETCLHCIAEPKFTREQLAEVLATKHAAALDQISETAWDLAALPAGMVAREVRRLAGLAEAPRRAARKRAVARGVAATAE